MHNLDSLKLPWLLVASPQLLDPVFKCKVVLIVEHGSTGSMGFVLNHRASSPLADLVTVPYVKIPPQAIAWMGGPVDRQSGVILAHRSLTHDRISAVDAKAKHLNSFDSTNTFGSLGSSTGYSLSSSEEALVELVHYFKYPKSVLAQDLNEAPEEPQDASLLGAQTRTPKAMPIEFSLDPVVPPLAHEALSELYPLRFLIGYAGWGRGQLEQEIKSGAWIQVAANPKLVFDTPWQDLWHECMSQVGVNPPAFAPSHHAFLH